MMTTKLLLAFLVGLLIIQIVLAIPIACRLIIETINTIDLQLSFGIRLPFDWEYVRKGISR